VISSSFTKVRLRRVGSIKETLSNAPDCSRRFLSSATAMVSLRDILHSTSLGGRVSELSNRTILIATRDQLTTALALIELDGIAKRLVIVTPDLSFEHIPFVISRAGVDAIVFDGDLPDRGGLGVPLRVKSTLTLVPARLTMGQVEQTEWVLLTSGTTGRPKMVVHSLPGLTAAIDYSQNQEPDVVWGTFYDIRRYGGLQILLRALFGRGSFVLSSASESPGDFLLRLGECGVTHISGTPSHWRRALMSRLARAISPRYVRLSGEIADQAILNSLRVYYPQAAIGHAFASTEAGVGFDVNDGLEGFPANVVDGAGAVRMKVVDGSLRIRSSRVAVRYLGEKVSTIADNDGFVDTGDMVEMRGDRYYFLGRRTGVINVGGLKVYPEEVEAVINRHSAVRMSVVRARRSSLTGSLVVADIVLSGDTDSGSDQVAALKREVMRLCQEVLPPHKVPVAIRIVPALDVAGAGKLARPNA
jgi:acyl-coenzyme A synthetase/AMP-(fatty) acid ligase